MQHLTPQPHSRAPDDKLASRLRGFGPVGLLAILVILAGNLVVAPLSAVLVLAWAWRSHTPWREIGYVRPTSWIRDLLLGIAFGAAFKILMKTVVMPLLGADPINHAYHHLVGNTNALPGMVLLLIVVAGFGEETLFRGYMFERLQKLLGTGAIARVSIVLLTAALFGLAHYPEQGLAGVQQASVFGIVFGAVFALTGQIWILMCAHAAFDLTALAIIYLDLESYFARLVFG
jgi:membrane protease YdiL (CAAX protease family)